MMLLLGQDRAAPAARRPAAQHGRELTCMSLPVRDQLRLRAMGAVFGRTLVVPGWTSQQESGLGSWSRLCASAGDAGALHWWSRWDGRRQGSRPGEAELSLAELKLEQVGWDTPSAAVCSSLLPLPLALSARPFLTLSCVGSPLTAAPQSQEALSHLPPGASPSQSPPGPEHSTLQGEGRPGDFSLSDPTSHPTRCT